jgi:hypothetical protein
MSRRQDNAQRRKNREENRRRKKAAQRKKNTARQAKQSLTEARVGNSGVSIAPTGHHHSRTHRFLHWVIIATYIVLGVLLLTGRHDPRVIGCAYCMFGAIHARLLVAGGIV